MAEAEGVIKFNLSHREDQLEDFDVTELNAWRSVFIQLGLLGQVSDRYDGYGFGNVSMLTKNGFLITGTQTGGLAEVKLENYALCDTWDLATNSVSSVGNVKPSSESLSHAAVYDVHEEAQCALHVHSPDLWQNAERLGITITDPTVAYGTPEMAQEVHERTRELDSPGIFSMGGHEDGIFTFGRTLEEAGLLMVKMLMQARSLESR